MPGLRDAPAILAGIAAGGGVHLALIALGPSLASLPTAVIHGDAIATVVRDGQEVVAEDGAKLAKRVVALAESCSVDASAFAASTDEWASTETSRFSLRVVFPDSGTASIVQGASRIRAAQPIHEIRLSLPHGDWPRHVLVSTGSGIALLTKYDPRALGELATLPELGLTAVAPYDSLAPSKPRP